MKDLRRYGDPVTMQMVLREAFQSSERPAALWSFKILPDPIKNYEWPASSSQTWREGTDTINPQFPWLLSKGKTSNYNWCTQTPTKERVTTSHKQLLSSRGESAQLAKHSKTLTPFFICRDLYGFSKLGVNPDLSLRPSDESKLLR